MAHVKPVLSAEKVAAVRAIGARDPLVRNPDHLAAHFLGAKHRFLVALLGGCLRGGRWLMERKAPGGYWYLQARTKHIDLGLKRALAAGAEQVVILGAGYDTRAYRFGEELAGVRVFEVDVAATQEAKRRHLRRLFGVLPEHVSFVAVDFNRESWLEGVKAAGYEADKRSYFIWEGVSYYLPEESVRSVLGTIRDHAPEGSGLVLDYILEGALRGEGDWYGAREAVALWKEMGEPGRFGFRDARHARSYLAELGLEVTGDLDSREMERRYDVREGGGSGGRIVECMRFLDAVVRRKGTA